MNEVNAEKSMRSSGLRKARNKPKNVPVSAFFKKVVDLDELPIVLDPVTGMLSNKVRSTGGYFTLTYNPEGSPKRMNGKPYCVGQDLIAGRICVSGPAHFHKLCERIPELMWLKKWSFLTDDLWALAKKHPGVAFGFNVRWAEYGAMIEQKADAMGIDIDHKPFLVYITNAEKMKELREKYQMMPPRTKEDIQSVLDEVDAEIKK
jgi:hypothetical protein